MKDERGFFTVIGLCFLLAVSICIKNIQESEAIYSFNAADYQAEQELQNAADSALIEAAEKIQKVKLEGTSEDLNKIIPIPPMYYASRSERQYHILTTTKNYSRLKNIEVKVYGERSNIHKELGKDSDATISFQDKEGVILISVASANSRLDDKKIYRRSLAFIYLADDTPNKIFYLNSL